MASISGRRPRGKYVERPAPCIVCGAPAWWNGSRLASSIRKTAEACVDRVADQVRRRARCSDKSCRKNWTVYQGDAYPHRSFGLEMVVSAVLMVVMAGATITAAASAHLCSRRSVARWLGWIGGLAEARELERLCTRVGAEPLPSSTRGAPPALRVLELLERLAELLLVRGVPLPGSGSGLARVLIDRSVRFGEVFWLTKPSPSLRGDRIGLGV